MTKKRPTILDLAVKNVDEKIAALEEQLAALRLARQHLQAEQEEALRRRRAPVATLAADKAS